MWIGLTVAFASALVTNTAYSLEHTDAWLQWQELVRTPRLADGRDRGGAPPAAGRAAVTSSAVRCRTLSGRDRSGRAGAPRLSSAAHHATMRTPIGRQ